MRRRPPTSEGTCGTVPALLSLPLDENKLPKSFVNTSVTADTPCLILLSTVSAAPFMVSVALDKVDAGGNGAAGKASVAAVESVVGSSVVVGSVVVGSVVGSGVGSVVGSVVVSGASAGSSGAPVCMSV